MKDNKGQLSITEQFQREHDRKILHNIRHAHARLGETLGGMNTQDQSYEHLNFASSLLLVAEQKIEEGLRLIDERKSYILTLQKEGSSNE